MLIPSLLCTTKLERFFRLSSQGTAGHRVDPSNAFDRALLAGARLTAAIRRAIEEELGYTVSAGIASNKMLAKIASSRNKPNKQVNTCSAWKLHWQSVVIAARVTGVPRALEPESVRLLDSVADSN